MIRGLILYLSLRRLRGRTIGVSIRSETVLGLRDASFGPTGVRGLAVDGDEIFVPWEHFRYVQWGPATERVVARRLKLARAAASGDGDPLDAILRAVATRQGAEPDEPRPALSREEIAAVLAEDADGPGTERG